jgi:hypothetical protein
MIAGRKSFGVMASTQRQRPAKAMAKCGRMENGL